MEIVSYRDSVNRNARTVIVCGHASKRGWVRDSIDGYGEKVSEANSSYVNMEGEAFICSNSPFRTRFA